MRQDVIDALKKKYEGCGKEPFIPRLVYIGIPAHDGKHDVEFNDSLMLAQDMMREYEVQFVRRGEGGGGICLARQEIAYDFMISPCDCLFFLDSDVVFSPEAFFHILTCPADISAGVYPLKTLDYQGICTGAYQRDPDAVVKSMKYPVNISDESRKGGVTRIDIPNFLEVESVGTGMMRIKKKVIGQIQLDHPELEYKNDPERAQNAIFNNTLKVCPDRCTRIFVGEDYSFCDLARASGFKVYVDLKYPLWHVGRFKYPGHFGKWVTEGGNRTMITPESKIDGAAVQPALSPELKLRRDSL